MSGPRSDLTKGAKTGADYARLIRQFAHDEGLNLGDLCARLGNQSRSFLSTLELAARPKPQTIAKIEALLAGRPMPVADRALTLSLSDATHQALARDAKRRATTVTALAAKLLSEAVGVVQ